MITIKKSKSKIKYFKIARALLAFIKTKTPHIKKYSDFYGKKAHFYAHENGKLVGGIMCQIQCKWLFIDMLYIDERMRGQDIGSRLIAEAENYARANNLMGLFVHTFEFQARPFYEKCGFKVVGCLENMPPESKAWTLQKEF